MSRKIAQYKLDNQELYVKVTEDESSAADIGEISYIGVQGLPGTQIGINSNKTTNLTIGYTGVYEADFSSFSGAYLRSIYVPSQSGTILVDLLYSGSLDEEKGGTGE